MDYAEPNQRALLVEGIRPVLPLIRNTPYGKRIQNKLQREQMDPFGGYQHQQALVNMALSNQGMGAAHGAGRHMSQPLQSNVLTDVYGAQTGLYPMQQSQSSFAQAHLPAPPHHSLGQSIDGYVLQGNSNHTQGLTSQLGHGGGFSTTSFSNVGPFGAGLTSSLADPYQRSAFGYGM